MRLTGPINLNQVQMFRGVVDFYYWKTIPVARAWPRHPAQPNTVAQVDARDALKRMHTILKTAPSYWHDRMGKISCPLGISNEDYKRKIALNLAHQGLSTLPPVPTTLTLAPQPDTRFTWIYAKMNPPPGFDPDTITFRAIDADKHVVFPTVDPVRPLV